MVNPRARCSFFGRAVLACAGVLLFGFGCGESKRTVVVYTSVDDIFARPIAESFTASTGIRVKLVTDTEETKSTGLVNRLIAEKGRPQADVFWSGDPMRAALLKQKGVLSRYVCVDDGARPAIFSDPEGFWTGFSARARVLIVNTKLVPAADMPRGIRALADPKWKGKAGLANPLFGTTSMHVAALFEALGEAEAKTLFEAMLENDVAVLSSNGEVKRRVASGELAFGVTDTDDAAVAIAEGKPVTMVFPDSASGEMGTLVVPNAVAMIAGGPNPADSKIFVDYLLSAAVEAELARSGAAQIPLRPGVEGPKGMPQLAALQTMRVDYSLLAARAEYLARGYVKEWVERARN
jgi:iron(III) transport system substrate-binding protein